MGDYCTNCGTSASRRYALTFDGERTISDIRLCTACLEAFRGETWIEITDAPQPEPAAQD